MDMYNYAGEWGDYSPRGESVILKVTILVYNALKDIIDCSCQ